MNYRHQGFTLVELVMVIVLLGILAATAMPRFADLGTDAKESVFQAVKGNFQTGIRVVYSKSLLHKGASGYPDVSLEGICIKVDATSGYPVVNQNSGTCSAVAEIYDPKSDVSSALATLYHWLRQSGHRANQLPAGLPGIPVVLAVPPPPPPPPPAASSLPAKLMDGDFTGWTWSENPPLGTLTSPESRSFTYNQNTGSVN